MQRIETPGIAHYAYIIESKGAAAIFDPCRDIKSCREAARHFGARVTHVIETHRHEDFVMGSACLARQTGAQIVNGQFETFGHGDLRLTDGDTFRSHLQRRSSGRARCQHLTQGWLQRRPEPVGGSDRLAESRFAGVQVKCSAPMP
jgi:glyoxylase-like metal-dependent hydrolase (beta-lactamase superfamily II)